MPSKLDVSQSRGIIIRPIAFFQKNRHADPLLFKQRLSKFVARKVQHLVSSHAKEKALFGQPFVSSSHSSEAFIMKKRFLNSLVVLSQHNSSFGFGRGTLKKIS